MLKKYIVFLLVILLITGCSAPITVKYPQVEKDFLENDYDELKKLSKDSKSYLDLCEKYIKEKCDKRTNNVINNLNNAGDLLGLKCKKEKKKFILTYNYKIYGKTIKTKIVTKYKSKKYCLKTISFDLNDTFVSFSKDLINVLEKSEDTSDKIYSNISDDFDISNNIYTSSEKYYYLPLDKNELIICVNSEDIPSLYQSATSYFNNVIRENDRKINELEKSLQETERLYGR